MSATTSSEASRHDSLGPTNKPSTSHVNDWPNAAGFQALSEQREPIALKVTGRFPSALAGTLLRTGPAQREVDGFKLSHWFDGFSQIYRFQLLPQSDGSCSVLYNSRRQVDLKLEQARRTGRLDGMSFGQKRDPCVGFFGKVKATFAPHSDLSDPANANAGVTIYPTSPGSDGRPRLQTGTDRTLMKFVDAETLEPVGVSDQAKLHPDLKGPMSSAHAHFDPVTGHCYNYNLAFGAHATYRVFCTDPATGDTKILATITGADLRPAYIHSFFLTENFVVLCVWEAQFASNGLSILWERNLLDAISPFDKSAKTTWYVVDRKGGKGLVKKLTSKAMFAFHTINAFEEVHADGSVDILADLDEYPSLDVLHRLYYENLVSDSPGARQIHNNGGGRLESTVSSMARYRLSDVKSGNSKKAAKAVCTMRIPAPKAGELPTINPAHHTKPYRYFYGLCDRGLSSFMDGLVRTDLQTGEATYWSTPKHTPGEAIFVADPERLEKEDGGWLLSCILNGETGTSYLLCLDAENMREVARAEDDVAWGIGFHGNYAKM